MAEDNKNIDFHGLIIKYLSGETSDSEVDQLEKWVMSSSENKAQFNAFKKAWVLSGIDGNYQKIDVKKEWKSTATQLFTQPKIVPLKAKPKRRISLVWSAAAAVTLLIVASVWLFQYLNNSGYIEVVTQNEIEDNQLPDGTELSLNQYSSVRFATKTVDNIRKIELTGDAFFEVERDTLRPFLISTQNLEIEVLGTAFYVDSREDQPAIQVIVQSGSVSMTAGAKKIILAANEIGIYDKPSGDLSKKENDDVNYMSWKTNKLEFQATSLERVIFDLDRRFHSKVSLSNPALGACEITATYDNQPLEAIVRIIEQTLGITAEIDGENITFSGQGCE